jgi:hypothetical protein
MKTYGEFVAEDGEMDGLHLLPHMKRSAKDNKMHALVTMHPAKFLTLTTKDQHHYDEIKQAAHSLHKYNELAAGKEILHAPHLRVGHDGQVKAHEGRHRAAALLNAGHDKMHVYLRAPLKEGKPERHHGFDDVPHKITGQGGRGFMTKDQMTLHQDYVAKLRDD